MRKFPNASIISILTTDSSIVDSYNLVFVTVTIVPDYYDSPSPFWYQGKGKGRSASFVCTSDKVRQWIACGNDGQIQSLFDRIITAKELFIEGRILKIQLPEFHKELYISNPYIDRRQNNADIYKTKNNLHIPRKLLEDENCKILSGYTHENHDFKHLFPTGIYEKNELIGKFQDQILASNEQRKPYLTFHGRHPKKIGADIEKMTGFYQEDFKPEVSYEARLYNNDKTVVGTSVIDKSNGVFHTSITDPSGKGWVNIYQNEDIVSSTEYALIKNFNINTDIASSTLVDAYGRKIMITEQTRIRPNTIENSTFQREIFSTKNAAYIKLTDTFTEVLKFLGPKIVIADPYYFNNIKEDNITKSFAISDCQSAFLNAIIITAITSGISELSFLGCSRANNHFDKDESQNTTTKQQRFERYQKLFSSIISSNKLTEIQVNFLTTTDFHNRYWFGLAGDSSNFSRVVAVTNSFGIMDEVDFFHVTGDIQGSLISHKYYRLYKNATHESTI